MSTTVRPSRLLAILTLAGALALSACGPVKELSRDDRAKLDREASTLFDAGKVDEAAGVYLEKARDAEEPARSDLALSAMKIRLRADNADAARTILDGPLMRSAGNDAKLRGVLLLAEDALQRQQPRQVLSELDRAPPRASASLALRTFRLRADAQRALGDNLGAAHSLAGLIARLPHARQGDASRELWQVMQNLDTGQLDAFAADEPGDSWADLLDRVRRHALDPTALNTSITQWRELHGDHPAVRSGLLEDIASQNAGTAGHPARIGILLPLTGKLAAAGQSVRDGILSAYYRGNPASRPALRFYDTAQSTAGTEYGRAITDGAGAIIGPLSKDGLRQIAAGGNPRVPVLALNRDDELGAPPSRLFQFGLSPEDEARQAAQRMLADEHRKILILAPQGDWGDRVVSSFSAELTELDATALDALRFDGRAKDFSKLLESGLGLQDSRERRRDITALLGQKVGFEPRRRQDLQGIFIAAPAWQARLLKPQLKFHYAGDVETYSISSAFSGRIDPEADRDLEGLRFPDAPWMVGDGEMAAERSRTEAAIPTHHGGLQRFYALGYDAYTLVPLLGRMRMAANQGVPGATGELYSDADGHIIRTLLWAEFVKGQPRLMVNNQVSNPATSQDINGPVSDAKPEAGRTPPTQGTDANNEPTPVSRP
ncbi:MAG: penicillin-binding protein activator [Gammaproteobacteria bacterium]